MLDVKKIREDFPIFSEQPGNFVYLDSSATTLKPRSVIDAVNEYYRSYSANVHRSIYEIGEKATAAYESSREKAAKLINAPTNSIIFTKGTTESINLVAYAWARKNLNPGDEILLTEMEHHSNLIPWQLCAQETGAKLRFIPFNEDGTLDLSDPDQYFNSHTKLVSVIHQSNVFGTINPIDEIVKMAHDVGAIALVDAAQSVPHQNVDVAELNCDLLAFSGHKMLGPTGVGVLFGKQEFLERLDPFLGGGEMIKTVSLEKSTWNEIPWKFEAGTPNIAQAIGLGAAIDYINELGLDRIHEHEQDLKDHALESLGTIEELTVYGHAEDRGAVISFNLDNIHPHDLSQLLDNEKIAIRAGHHCAQPIMKKLGVAATGRASFYLYNSKEDVDRLCESLLNTLKFMGVRS
ncbi:MAG TPA: cysteine desulfurase [Candidatus Marinimicrobia bacterium]|jgi:cysteine desulfurase/selenocysteine lyase|nr:cysteine desulfurase [Candidatus Neomarinimicrobiota bacterium]MDP7216657.1 cysteine desulfurase [Candidatus Neomarinimicrobiota bacterium]MDP7437660.1 cysteine desulfurase [Candidatus Neomarinimicrobiota bacterium]HJM70040.1 cysteine desulfurase [Candidatus Neomarinimicrobiota bacterium]|tara:strand:+ start:13111 stop:14328 length:1218 start_codon:yes stop_codon:yes gene_type:complete